MNLKTALFAGTFEVFHQGHIDVLEQASKLFDHVYVAVSYNPYKNSLPIDQRLISTQKVIKSLNLKNVTVIQNNGFGVICAKIHNCQYLIRGIRTVKDVEYELELAIHNQELEPSIRTIFLVAKNELQNISSSSLLTRK
ncbi:Pantetheine-phosphate adenylyltransferase [[Mycoplasma] cavipharyngis]|uniref:pantetheine-phosphate adenylyltransferase n=1 Tax=[Mycoplasma] cavipharyngis TaxID=92757 RepID=UPI0037049A41